MSAWPNPDIGDSSPFRSGFCGLFLMMRDFAEFWAIRHNAINRANIG